MIIDRICDIIDCNAFTEEDARYIYGEATTFKFYDITRALDGGTPEDVKACLSAYIIKAGYNINLVPRFCAVPIVGNWCN